MHLFVCSYTESTSKWLPNLMLHHVSHLWSWIHLKSSLSIHTTSLQTALWVYKSMIYMYVCMYVCMYEWMYVCIYHVSSVYIYINHYNLHMTHDSSTLQPFFSLKICSWIQLPFYTVAMKLPYDVFFTINNHHHNTHNTFRNMFVVGWMVTTENNINIKWYPWQSIINNDHLSFHDVSSCPHLGCYCTSVLYFAHCIFIAEVFIRTKKISTLITTDTYMHSEYNILRFWRAKGYVWYLISLVSLVGFSFIVSFSKVMIIFL